MARLLRLLAGEPATMTPAGLAGRLSAATARAAPSDGDRRRPLAEPSAQPAPHLSFVGGDHAQFAGESAQGFDIVLGDADQDGDVELDRGGDRVAQAGAL